MSKFNGGLATLALVGAVAGMSVSDTRTLPARLRDSLAPDEPEAAEPELSDFAKRQIEKAKFKRLCKRNDNLYYARRGRMKIYKG